IFILSGLVLSTVLYSQIIEKNTHKVYHEKVGADKLYSVEALKGDLIQIRDILIDNHPAVYQFTSKERFNINFMIL
ncbi:hypothetical protein ACFLSI_06755, partial [Bacteroidota bacterium]